jgi:hypothetical protein
MPGSPLVRDRARVRTLLAAALVLGTVGAGLLVVGSAGALPLPPASPSSPSVAPVVIRAPERVSLFGDSLARQASDAFVAALRRRVDRAPNVQTYPGTALCDYRNHIVEDLMQHRPQVLVLEFSGNSGTDCMRDRAGDLRVIGSAGWRAQYLVDLRAILKVADLTRTRVVWATAPPVSPVIFPSDYTSTLARAIRTLEPANSRLRVVDTGAALTTDGSFAHSLPCRPDEHAGCRDGRIAARSVDGLHFDCQGLSNPLGACLGYSAGSRRFGEAIAVAAATWGRG